MMEVPTLRDLSMQKVFNENIDYSCLPRTLTDEINYIRRKETLVQLLGSKFNRSFLMLIDYKNIRISNNIFVETDWNYHYYNSKIGYFLSKYDSYYCTKLLGDDFIDKIANMLLDYKITRDNGIEMLYYFDEYYDILNVWDGNIYDWKEVDNPDNRYESVNEYKELLESIIIYDLQKRSSNVF